ncbi:MAG: hypothetical protein AAF800_01770 [Planctomycetota bacterium]
MPDPAADRPLRVVLALQLCDPELDLALTAVEMFLAAAPGADAHVLLTDDASTAGVGDEAVRRIQRLGPSAELLPMTVARGFHGTGTRVGRLLDHAQQHAGDDDLVVKIDTDTLFVSDRFGPLLRELSQEPGPFLAGQSLPLRKRDALLMLADTLPLGFRRRVVAGVLEHGWGPRFRPTVVTGQGLRALRHGYRFRFFGGGLLVLNRPLLDAMARRHLLDWSPRRLGLLFHDDVVVTILAAACRAKAIHLPDDGTLRLRKGATLADDVDPQWCFVHPVKNGPEGDRLRDEVRARFAAG